MRVITFIIFLCFFLLGGGHHSNATNFHNHISYSSSQNFSNNRLEKITNESDNFILIEESDIDLEEEYAKPNDFKNLNYNRITSEKFIFLNKWHSILYNHYIFNIPSKDSKNFPQLCGKSNPIYITQRVLRI